MIKKGMATLVVIILIVSVFAFVAGYGERNTSNNLMGTGTPEDPYMIHDVWELQDIRDDLSAHYALANDIEASVTSGWNDGAGFVPIGDNNIGFTGTFDGRNHTIMGLYINRPSTDYVGLFGWVDSNGVVSNVGLDEYTVYGGRASGGLVGVIIEGTVSNSYAIGTVTSDDDAIGGLVGWNENGMIVTSFAKGSVTGHDYVGGLSGWNRGVIHYCYADAEVFGTGSYVGGLAGENRLDEIRDSYALGNATGNNRVAGLVGRNAATITNTYSTGIPSGGTVGGLVQLDDGSVFTSFWDVDTSGTLVSDGGTGLGTEDMQTESTFTDAGWDFEDVWWIIEGETYPLLWWQTITEPPSVELISPTGGETWDALTEQDISWSTTPGDGEITGVDIYYSIDGGASWTNIVFGAPDDGLYTWMVPDEHTAEAKVRVTVHDDYDTSGTNTSENFNIVGIPPEPPANLDVEHHGVLNETFVETRYMRADGDLGTEQTGNEQQSHITSTGGGAWVRWGMRVWAGDTEITGATPEAVVERTASGEGMQSATWNCPETELDRADAIQIRIYASTENADWTEQATFETETLDSDKLNETIWTVHYYTRANIETGGAPGSRVREGWFHWDTETHNSRIEDFTYSVIGDSLTVDNKITWDASLDDPDKVTHYQVYRSETETGTYENIATINADGSASYQYIDSNKGTADEILWWYQIYSYNNGQYSDEPVGPVQEPDEEEVPVPDTFDITLTPGGAANGWNFVSFNLELTDTSLGDILADIEDSYDKVMYYDASAGQWRSHVPGRSERFNNLENWNHHMGLWIHATDDATLTVEGSAPANTDITLYPGWNMVGLPSENAGNHGLPAEVSRIGYFDAGAEYNMEYVYDNLDQFDFHPGEGYIVYLDYTETVIWNIEY